MRAKKQLPKLNEYEWGTWYKEGDIMCGTCIKPILPTGYEFDIDTLFISKEKGSSLWEFHVRIVGW